MSLLLALTAPAMTQDAQVLETERAEFANWLRTAPTSPYAAIYHQPLAGELRLGPDAPPRLGALQPAWVREARRGLTLETVDGTRPIPRHRAVMHGRWRVRVGGVPGRSTVTIFGQIDSVSLHGWYPHDPAATVVGTLDPPAQPEMRRLLALDGLEVEASRAGTFRAEIHGTVVQFTVYRIPEPGSEEAELQIFFRDATSGNGSYPAGRFLPLTPLGGNRYRADFNRARNPFCAYNTVFPCPLPWRGNTIEIPVMAGERYQTAAERS